MRTWVSASLTSALVRTARLWQCVGPRQVRKLLVSIASWNIWEDVDRSGLAFVLPVKVENETSAHRCMEKGQS